MSEHSERLLRAILAVTARQAFPPERILQIVLAKGSGPRQLDAYNLCNGTKGQGEIAKELKLDAGNFSRTVGRWIESGIVFRLGEGREARLLHIYPVPTQVGKKSRAAQ